MSRYVFRPMDEKDAREIAAWRYEAPYDFYDTANEQDDLSELLDPQRREGTYFSGFDERGALVEVFMHHTNGAEHPFLLMAREA
jgi:[ribosomal protein S18]-alanine N-acetyltransferase